MKLKTFAIGLIAVAVSASPAFANYVNNRSDWNRLGAGGKAAYAIGLHDALSVRSSYSDAQNAMIDGRNNCVVALRLLSADLVELIDQGYTDPSVWAHPPVVVYAHQIERVCLSYINAARRDVGLEPLPGG